MSELRKDYFLDEWVLISEKRSRRPDLNKKEFGKKTKKHFDKKCFFCPGNERFCGQETFRLNKGNNWTIRVVKNLFPAVDSNKQNIVKKKHPFYISKNAYGYHEVIIDSDKHDKNLEDFGKEHIRDLLSIFISRINLLSKDKKIRYVGIFKNHKKEAGASIPHSHCQLIAYNHFPEKIRNEIASVKKHKYCIYCKILNMESKSQRRCFENKTFVAFAPYASQFPYEIKFFPKRHVNSLISLNENELLDLAELLKKALLRLKKINSPYNLYLHDFPELSNSHFHIKIAPRANIMAGFEFETGTIINVVYPEKAAKFYRK